MRMGGRAYAGACVCVSVRACAHTHTHTYSLSLCLTHTDTHAEDLSPLGALTQLAKLHITGLALDGGRRVCTRCGATFLSLLYYLTARAG